MLRGVDTGSRVVGCSKECFACVYAYVFSNILYGDSPIEMKGEWITNGTRRKLTRVQQHSILYFIRHTRVLPWFCAGLAAAAFLKSIEIVRRLCSPVKLCSRCSSITLVAQVYTELLEARSTHIMPAFYSFVSPKSTSCAGDGLEVYEHYVHKDGLWNASYWCLALGWFRGGLANHSGGAVTKMRYSAPPPMENCLFWRKHAIVFSSRYIATK